MAGPSQSEVRLAVGTAYQMRFKLLSTFVPTADMAASEKFYHMWIFYLSGATAAFESGGMCNHQYQFVRNRRALTLSRDYMAEAEKTYPAKG